MIRTDIAKNLAYRRHGDYVRVRGILGERGELLLNAHGGPGYPGRGGINTQTDVYHIDGSTVILEGTFEWFLPRNLEFQYMTFTVSSDNEEKERRVLEELESLVSKRETPQVK